MPSEPSFYPAVRRDTAIKIKPDLAPLSSVACPQCGGYHTTRAHRRTFFQKVVLVRLGYYPWKCIDCSHRFRSKDRGHHRAVTTAFLEIAPDKQTDSRTDILGHKLSSTDDR